MGKMLINRIIIVIALCGFTTTGFSQEQAFGLEEKSGAYLPDSVWILNEDSVPFLLDDIITRPTLLTFVYYHCSAQCPAMLEGIAELINLTHAEIGTDYQVLTISIDHHETPGEAAKAKNKYFDLLNRKINPMSWRFLTADSADIRILTSAVGWEFRSDGEHFVHPTASVLITPDKMVSQYFYGTYFNYMHFAMSVEKAANEEIVPTRVKTLKYCYNYKPADNILLQRVVIIYGTGIVLVIVAFFLILVIKRKKNTKSS